MVWVALALPAAAAVVTAVCWALVWPGTPEAGCLSGAVSPMFGVFLCIWLGLLQEVLDMVPEMMTNLLFLSCARWFSALVTN